MHDLRPTTIRSTLRTLVGALALCLVSAVPGAHVPAALAQEDVGSICYRAGRCGLFVSGVKVGGVTPLSATGRRGVFTVDKCPGPRACLLVVTFNGHWLDLTSRVEVSSRCPAIRFRRITSRSAGTAVPIADGLNDLLNDMGSVTVEFEYLPDRNCQRNMQHVLVLYRPGTMGVGEHYSRAYFEPRML